MEFLRYLIFTGVFKHIRGLVKYTKYDPWMQSGLIKYYKLDHCCEGTQAVLTLYSK